MSLGRKEDIGQNVRYLLKEFSLPDSKFKVLSKLRLPVHVCPRGTCDRCSKPASNIWSRLSKARMNGSGNQAVESKVIALLISPKDRV